MQENKKLRPTVLEDFIAISFNSKIIGAIACCYILNIRKLTLNNLLQILHIIYWVRQLIS